MDRHGAISTPASPDVALHHPPISSTGTSSSGTPSRPSSSCTSPAPTVTTPLGPDHVTLERRLDALSLTIERKVMFSTLETIFRRAGFQEPGVSFDIDLFHAMFVRADQLDSSGEKDVETLRQVRNFLQRMRYSRSEAMAAAAQVLADGSRDPAWRIPYGEAGILTFFLEVVFTVGTSHEVTVQTLRLIGNVCADTDSNRQAVVSRGSLLPIIERLQDESLVDIVIPVLFNICTDYEPAQEAAATHLLCPTLIDLLQRRSFIGDPQLGYICRLLDYTMDKFDSSQCPDHCLEILLRNASSTQDLEDQISLVNATSTLLQTERFQKLLITQDLVELLLSFFIRSYSSHTFSNAPLSTASLSPLVREPEEEAQLSAARGNLMHVLADVSADPEFAAKFPLNSSLVRSLLVWLSVPQIQPQVCACIVLGNLARSDTICREMVHEHLIHEPLIAKLKESSDTQVLHSTLPFLRNLALPSDNKSILGDAGIIPAASRFWTAGTVPQLQYAAASLTRQLVNGSMHNTRIILAPLSPDPESPANEKTYLSLLLSLFERSDDGASTNIEIARTVATICRSLNSPEQANDLEDLELMTQRFYKLHPNVAKPLSMMVSQKRWPVIRSEGWFALALMARSRDGSAAVSELLSQVEVFGPLVETITGRITPETAEATPGGSENAPTATETEREREMRAKDRDNARVLVSELLKNRGDEMSVIRRGVFEDLLRGREPNLTLNDLMARVRT